MKIKNYTKIFIGLLLIACNISCDQITKKQVRKRIEMHEQISIVKNNFILTNVENTGAALSFGQQFSPVVKLIIFQIIPILVLVYLFFYIIQKVPVKSLHFIAITFIIGGGIGNIIDRILYQSVTDFMYLEAGTLHTGIFNMADVSVTLGAITLAIQQLAAKRKLKPKMDVIERNKM